MSITLPSRFGGRRAFVTGSSQGIGLATAQLFAREGARVAVNGHRPEALEDALTSLPGGPHVALPGDISAEDSVAAMFRTLQDAFGGLDILVCNAGIQTEEPSDSLTLDAFTRVMAVNVTGVVLCARAALHQWRAEGRSGTIVINSSVHQIIPKPGYLGYSASKGAVGNIVRTLALEFARHGIRVNGVAPGAIETPMNDAWTSDPAKREAVCRHIPMHRPGTSDEIAEAIAFLASDAASYVTGQTLYVDGGLTLYNDFAENWAS
ncbi:NAD/NADP-dependent glucose 1-dehydrogenase [Ameyamaea chiangmaiensis NBRC 103196]|uniref:Glucose 1-dehydrogenase n=1 Tax=Ameyamaea chiangmaiensis TaxID=442969 RepID=A0A850PCN3_9PROT|nr:glucose 1-dehydrogenase [Ameyamaea chiangmaiensis]MBS4075345.1 glucose 1-dehydrogenase [Ameyamaea chiangmaiensis]NVN40663.1 glucose 1-dehydrogenase [Ameyamaea chiangmaiensis]GBQ70107.1 NAD/NADP-dependent glucose 1-dehydrogenase [Ameyamaea chiangmaiensis NBRC 103196]